MNYIKSKLVYGLLTCLVALSLSCKKEVIGPKGDKGVAGGAGNLIQTHRTFTIPTSSWKLNLGVWHVKVYAPEINTNVINSGEVRVFMKIDNAWWSFPYAVGNLFMEQETELGSLYLKFSHIHGPTPPAPNQTEFKLVTYSPI